MSFGHEPPAAVRTTSSCNSQPFVVPLRRVTQFENQA